MACLLALLGGAVASAAPAPNGACGALVAHGAPVELPVRVAPGLTVRVRDPYGGVIARNRLFVAFSIRYARPADRARVASVTWLLDGQPPRRDEGGRDQLLAPSTMYAPGAHVVTVRITPVGGPPVEATLPVKATDCEPASIVARRDPDRSVVVDIRSGGPVLRAVQLGRLPAGSRLGSVTAGGRTWALRSSRIARLPTGTTALRVRLAPGVWRGRLCALAATLEGGSGPPVRVVPRC